MKAVILAGGKGSRLTSLTEDKIPKSLIKIGDKSIIEHQVILLRKYGIKEIWILSGFLGDQIKEYLQNGKKWNVSIRYLQEGKPLGTAGALKPLENKIKEDFLVLSGDVMLDFNVRRFVNWHKKKKGSIASLIVHPNDHPFDSDLVEVDNTGKVISLLKRPHSPKKTFRNLSIASGYIFSPEIFKYIKFQKKTDIEILLGYYMFGKWGNGITFVREIMGYMDLKSYVKKDFYKYTESRYLKENAKKWYYSLNVDFDPEGEVQAEWEKVLEAVGMFPVDEALYMVTESKDAMGDYYNSVGKVGVYIYKRVIDDIKARMVDDGGLLKEDMFLYPKQKVLGEKYGE